MEVSEQAQIYLNRANKAEIEVERTLQRVEELATVLRTVMILLNIMRRKSDDESTSARLMLITQYILESLPPNSTDSDLPF